MRAERERRRAEQKAAREAELAAKTPYEEEMDLCDYLVNYLTTTYIKKEAGEEKQEPPKKRVAFQEEEPPVEAAKPQKKESRFKQKRKGKANPKVAPLPGP